MEIAKTIQGKIYEVRGERVMLDKDLATLYATELRSLNQAVKRNIKRFPSNFMFQLTRKEWEALRSQIVILENGRGRYTKYLPYAFTEHGVTMLASVLNSDKAIEMNIAIVKVFIAIRSLVVHNHEILNQLIELRDRIGEHDVQLKEIYESLENMLDVKQEEKEAKESWEKRKRIGFKK
jgi:hypothetical protein